MKNMNRRNALGLLAGVPLAGKIALGDVADTSAAGVPISAGPFQPTRESLKAYTVPDWFRDAKFGIWAHWGPQSAPEDGDWYARNMYMEGSKQYKYHVANYGHPSKFGFKDVIPTWKGDKFDAEHLMQLYKDAGAKYFVSMGVHHDNFDMWNSRHTRWNAAKMGPRKDIVGMFRKAARKQGLRFGVSEHLWISYKWFAVSHGADKTGELAGVPYDGIDPKFADLYHDVDLKKLPEKMEWNANDIPDAWKRHWLERIKDLVDQHQPDLLYTDGALPFEDYGLRLVAHLYNQDARKHGGKVEAIYNSKRNEDCAVGTCVLDLERGIVDKVWPDPWQTDTCVGNWHYDRNVVYKTPKTVVDMLVDIVSRNGNLLLNFPLPNNGALDSKELEILSEITKWMKVNSEGIYSTRPWKIFGDGPALAAGSGADGKMNEKKRKTLTAEDVRFTKKGDTLYAFMMGWPQGEAVIRPLATQGALNVGKVQNVELLGYGGKISFKQDETGLHVQLPEEKPSDHAVALKILGA